MIAPKCLSMFSILALFHDLAQTALFNEECSPVGSTRSGGTGQPCAARATFRFGENDVGKLGSTEGVTFVDAVVDKVDGERRLLNLTVQAVGGDVIYDEKSEGGALSGEFASLNLKENRSTDFRLTFSEPLTAPFWSFASLTSTSRWSQTASSGSRRALRRAATPATLPSRI